MYEIKVYTKMHLVRLLVEKGIVPTYVPMRKISAYLQAHYDILKPKIQGGMGPARRYFFQATRVREFLELDNKGGRLPVSQFFTLPPRERRTTTTKKKGYQSSDTDEKIKIYSKSQLIRFLKKEIFPWMTYYAIGSYCDYFSNILHPVSQKQGAGKRYFVKSKDVMRLVRLFKEGKLQAPFLSQDMLSTMDIYKSRKIFWTNDYQTVMGYLKNPRYKHILKPVRLGDKVAGRRIYVSKKNLGKFVSLYKSGELESPVSQSLKKKSQPHFVGSMKVYTQSQLGTLLRQEGIIPWVFAPKVVRYLQLYYDILKPQVQSEGTAKRYFFKEENVTKFLRLYKNGKLPKSQSLAVLKSIDNLQNNNSPHRNITIEVYSKKRLSKFLKKEFIPQIPIERIKEICDEYAHILKPDIEPRRGGAQRYFYRKENVTKFLNLLKQGKLKDLL